jgi:hypothetical protein
MPTCQSCKHFQESSGEALCLHPQVTVDPVFGVSRPRGAANMRASDGPCGPEGSLWHGKGVRDPGPPEHGESLPAE